MSLCLDSYETKYVHYFVTVGDASLLSVLPIASPFSGLGWVCRFWSGADGSPSSLLQRWSLGSVGSLVGALAVLEESLRFVDCFVL